MSRWREAENRLLVQRLSWTSLLAVTVGLLFFSPFFQRPGGQRLAGEATRLMAAESLAFDGDLAYSRRDFDRHLLAWLEEPAALDLVSADGGKSITFGVSAAYSLWLAPFLKVWPLRGFAVANCCLFLLVAAACGALWQRLRGPSGPLLLGLCLFTSVVFCAPFVADGGLFGALATVAAFSLLGAPRGDRRLDLGALAAGALLALPASDLALHGLLVPAALVMVGHRRRLLLAVSFITVWGVLAFIPWCSGGGLSGGLGDAPTVTFEAAQGFPLVDFTADEWPEQAANRESGTFSTVAMGSDPGSRHPGLVAHALVDRLIGRRLGVVLFFPLLIPLLLAAVLGPWRRPLAWSVAAWCLLAAYVHPFDLEMGGSLWAGGRFLPVYGALVGAMARPIRREGQRRGLTAAWVVALLLAGVVMPSLWRSPWRAPVTWTQDAHGATGPQGALWWDVLPFETTQARLTAGDRGALGDLTWIGLDGRGWIEGRWPRLVVPADGTSEWLVASPRPLDLESLDGAPSSAGLDLLGLAVEPYGAGATVDLGISPAPGIGNSRRHRLLWTPGPQWLYRVRLTAGAPSGGAPSSSYLMLRPAAP